MLPPESILPLALPFTSPGSLLIHLGLLQIRWYDLLIASAVPLGTTLSQALAKHRGIKPEILSDLNSSSGWRSQSAHCSPKNDNFRYPYQ